MPLYETEDDVWKRVQAWLLDIVQDVSREEASSATMECTSRDGMVDTVITTPTSPSPSLTPSPSPTDTPTATSTTDTLPPNNNHHPIYHVFVLSHSGTLRAVIRTLVGSQLPSEIDLPPAGKDGARPGMLFIPNTSITVIDLEVRDDQLLEPNNILQTAKLVDLTRADHLENL